MKLDPDYKCDAVLILRLDNEKTAAGVEEIQRHAGIPERAGPPTSKVRLTIHKTVIEVYVLKEHYKTGFC